MAKMLILHCPHPSCGGVLEQVTLTPHPNAIGWRYRCTVCGRVSATYKEARIERQTGRKEPPS